MATFFRWILRTLPFIYMFLVWFQSSILNPSALDITSIGIGLAFVGLLLEFAHLFEFAILYLLIIIAFLTYGELSYKKEVLALTVSVLYAILDEIHQHFVPFRSASFFDLLKDVIGICIAWLIIHNKYFRYPDSRASLFLRKLTAIYYDRKEN